MYFTDYIDTIALSKLEGLKTALQELETQYAEIDEKLQFAINDMQNAVVYRGENKPIGGGYNYENLSATFKQLHYELIDQHQAAYLSFNNKDREYVKAKRDLIDAVGDKVALEYKRLAEELAVQHSVIYGILHTQNMNSAVQFRSINIPAGTIYGNLKNIAPIPHGRHALFHEGLAATNGNEMAKEVRKFMREY